MLCLVGENGMGKINRKQWSLEARFEKKMSEMQFFMIKIVNKMDMGRNGALLLKIG